MVRLVFVLFFFRYLPPLKVPPNYLLFAVAENQDKRFRVSVQVLCKVNSGPGSKKGRAVALHRAHRPTPRTSTSPGQEGPALPSPLYLLQIPPSESRIYEATNVGLTCTEGLSHRCFKLGTSKLFLDQGHGCTE